MKLSKCIVIILWVLLATTASGIRLLAARGAYPSCGDSSHFVQHGVALAHGVPGAMSTYWSQGMIAIAAGAVKMEKDPRYAMQATTLISGVMVCLLFTGIVWLLTKSSYLAFLSGMILSVNPTMVHYSITGYSEMPYMVFLMAGVCVGLSKRMNSVLKYGLAGMLFGFGGYFKGLDAAVAACGFGFFIILTDTHNWKNRMLYSLTVPTVAFIFLIPLCSFTYKQVGRFTPGSKGGQIVAGLDWADSKREYAFDGGHFQKQEAVKKNDVIKNIVLQLPKRIVVNFANTLRIFNGNIFCRGIRMGTIIFFLLVISVLSTLYKKRVKEALLPACLLVVQLGALWMVFVVERILVPSLPWMFLLFLLALYYSIRSNLSHRALLAMVFLFLLYLAVNTLYSVSAFTSEFFWWRYENMVKCAEQLKVFGGTDDDVIMTYGPAMAVEFNKTDPFKTVEVPFGTIEQVEQVASDRQVRFIVISDSFRSHWPIAKLFDDRDVAPSNWKLLEEISFPESEARGSPPERCRIYERKSQQQAL